MGRAQGLDSEWFTYMICIYLGYLFTCHEKTKVVQWKWSLKTTRDSDTRNLKKMYEDVRALAPTLACTGTGKVFARQRAYIELWICHIFCRCSFEIHWVPDLETGQCPRHDLNRGMLRAGIFPWCARNTGSKMSVWSSQSQPWVSNINHDCLRSTVPIQTHGSLIWFTGFLHKHSGTPLSLGALTKSLCWSLTCS